VTAYFISGQAADEKLFENLTLPSSIIIKHVRWIEPFKNEKLTHYVKRLLPQIDTTGDFVLIGVSLGGIVAVELTKLLRPRFTIIISSISTRKELPPHFRFFQKLRLHKIVPAGIYKWYNPFVNWYFGANNQREKELLKYYMKDATKNYMAWSVNEILNWKNEERPMNLLHIQGTADKIFLHQFTEADITIKGGAHIMVHNRADEISRILTEQLNQIR
jgi:pimeloyl-ACP methyl ester carboxylesterase